MTIIKYVSGKVFNLCTVMLILLIPTITNAATTADEYEHCITMNTAKISYQFSLDHSDEIFSQYPKYKQFYEDYLNNPLSAKCGWTYSTGVGCSCTECEIGQKLTECATPVAYRQACAKGIAFTELENRYKKEWLNAELIKKCGEDPSKNKPATAPTTTKTTEKTNTQQNNPKKSETAKAKKDNRTNSDSKVKEQKKADKSDKKSTKESAKEQKKADKKAAKEKECAAKNPPMDVKQNGLGMWVCTDSAETIAAREQQRETNTTLKTFWKDMDDLERAFNRRVQQLRKGDQK